MEKKKGSFSKIYLVVLSFITVICVVVGISINANGFGNDNGPKKDGNIEIGEFSELKVDLSITSVVIEKGSNWDIRYERVPEKIIPKVENKDGKLTVTQKKQKFRFNFFGFGSNGGKVYITIPEGANVSAVDTFVDTGSCTIENLLLGNIKISVDTGSVKVEKVVADKLEVDSDTGAVKIEDSSFYETIVDSDTGATSIDGLQGTKLKVTEDTGAIKIMDSTLEDIFAEADTGSIKVDSAFMSIDASTDTGSVNVNFDDKLCSEDEVKVKLKTDTGSVRYNGEKCGHKFEK